MKMVQLNYHLGIGLQRFENKKGKFKLFTPLRMICFMVNAQNNFVEPIWNDTTNSWTRENTTGNNFFIMRVAS